MLHLEVSVKYQLRSLLAKYFQSFHYLWIRGHETCGCSPIMLSASAISQRNSIADHLRTFLNFLITIFWSYVRQVQCYPFAFCTRLYIRLSINILLSTYPSEIVMRQGMNMQRKNRSKAVYLAVEWHEPLHVFKYELIYH